MESTPAPAERTQRPVLYGALVLGALAVIVTLGWLLLSPSLLLQRQVALATTQPAVTAPAAEPVARPVLGRVLDAGSGAPLDGRRPALPCAGRLPPGGP